MQDESRFGKFRVDRDFRDGTFTVMPVGELDIATAPLLDAHLHGPEWWAAKRVVLDLRGLTFMDSSGVRCLLRAEAASRADSNRLALIPGSAQIQRLLELTQAADRLPFVR
jgi:anti-sigma B factor antagonist